VAVVRPSPAAVIDPVETGIGFTEVVLGTQPAAGAGFSIVNDSRFASRLRTITFRFVTSAVVANRSVTVNTDDAGGNVVTRSGSGAVVQASTTALFSFDVHKGGADWDQNNLLFIPLADRWLHSGEAWSIALLNADAGDQLSQIVLFLERLQSDIPAAQADVVGT
jgi:hypothetical protein